MDERNDYNSIPMQHKTTAMQELIFELKLIDAYPMITLVLRMATDLLDKEKEQIIDAYIEGYTSWDSEMTSLEYYTKTYKKK
jgi:hypothetical protein